MILVLLCLLLSDICIGATQFKKLEKPNFNEKSATLIGGSPAGPTEFPAVLYTNQSGSRCTSTMVGPRALLTAAHCVDDGGTASFRMGGVSYFATCTHHPDYENNATADWAICHVNKTVANLQYESLIMIPGIPDVGDYLLLTGYGCTNSEGSGGNDGVLRKGYAEVIRTPRSGDWDIITRGSVALCFGDSGGPAFYEENGKRWLVSVNSRGNIRDTSYLSKTLSNPVFKDWITSWSNSKNAKICGLNQQCTNNEIPPEPDKNPKPNAGLFDLIVWLIIAALCITFCVFVYLKGKNGGRV